MNKKLLALAIGAAAALPVAALADGPTLYGKLNLSLEGQTTNSGVAAAKDNSNWVIANNASRFGLKGTADTNGSLKGIYNIELGLDADGDGAAAVANRETFAGLTGDFGTVKIGHFFSPLQNAQGVVDRFDDTTIDMAGYTTGENTALNAIQYTSPKLGDAVTLNLASMQGEGAPASGNTYDGVLESLSASAVYESGSFYAALAMDKDMIENGGGLNGVPAGTAIDATRLALAYNTDTLSVGLLYQTAEPVAGVADATTMILSGTYKAGDLTWKLQHGSTEVDYAVGSREGTVTALGADYAVGKSTTVTGFVAKADGVYGTTGPGGNGLGAATLDDAEATIISIGLAQLF